MLAVFAAVMVVGLSSIGGGGKTPLQRTDEFFNGLAKDSSRRGHNLTCRDDCGQAHRKLSDFAGRRFEASITARNPGGFKAMLEDAGCSFVQEPKGFKVEGDMVSLAKAVLSDADDMFDNNESLVAARRGMSGKEAMYKWSTLLGGLSRRLKDMGRVEESELALCLLTQRVEPAYNFYGVEAVRAGGRLLTTIALLVFYVVYTVWYGTAVYLVFRGLGLRAKRAAGAGTHGAPPAGGR